MRLKFGSLLLCAAMASTMSAQTPEVTGDIYSQIGGQSLSTGETVFYSFGSWYAGSEDALTPLFDQMVAGNVTSLVEGIASEADGISVSWNSVDKQLTVNCQSDKLGHTSVLIAAMDGATRGVVNVDQTPAVISLSDYASGIYAVAVAVDGKLIKTFKINLK
ncbi:MAG: hypothetical protein K2L45_03985 [Muribaculaceae bacterium]|nr:hypothetical protein [Muribaculaceae bacterium]MDE6631497.1 hypothetical protein [Muribaculaceae bacterium]